jgi:hypothetical protein
LSEAAAIKIGEREQNFSISSLALGVDGLGLIGVTSKTNGALVPPEGHKETDLPWEFELPP